MELGCRRGEEGLDLNYHTFPTFSMSAQFRLCCERHRAGKAQGAEEKASPCLPTVFFQGLRRPLMASAWTYDFSYREDPLAPSMCWPCLGPGEAAGKQAQSPCPRGADVLMK